MGNCDNYVDAVVKQTKTVVITKRIRLTMHGEQGFSVNPSPENVVGYHAECKAHRTKIEVSELQAECVKDSIAFCKKCLENAPAKKPDQTAEALRNALASAQCKKTKEDKKRWHVGRQFNDFINEIDIDL